MGAMSVLLEYIMVHLGHFMAMVSLFHCLLVPFHTKADP